METLSTDIIMNTSYKQLGKEIKISPKALVTITDKMFASVDIGIGESHSATFTMSVEAWKALNAGDKVSIETQKEFKKRVL